MSTTPNSRQKYAGTYFVPNQFAREEFVPLLEMDRMMTIGMGGVLPEQSDPSIFQSVADISCGAGDWVIELADTYPHISKAVGIDINENLITYAQIQAQAKQLGKRVEFRIMDALSVLEFPSATFDLVNLRLGYSYVRTWDWPNILSEFKRITRPGGIIRLTEADVKVESTSPALIQLRTLLLEAFYRSGHLFTPESNSVNSQLPSLLQRSSIQNIQERIHILEYHYGTPGWQSFYEHQKFLFRMILPFLRRWIRMPDNYEALYQQMLSEMQQADFVATWRLVTIWGQRPLNTIEQTLLAGQV